MTCCNDRRRFAEQFALAAREYSEAVARLVQHEGPPARAEYDALRSVVIEAQERCERAGGEFEQHLTKHGCGAFTNQSLDAASPVAASRGISDCCEQILPPGTRSATTSLSTEK
jgi:hypothetical protein